jgi:hypothetical protein
MEHCVIDTREKIQDSIIGAYSEIVSNSGKPGRRTFIVGERSDIRL